MITVGVGGNDSMARLELANNISLNNAIFLPARANSMVAILNINGSNTLSGNIGIGSGGSDHRIQSDAGLLMLTGTIDIANAGSRTINGSSTVNVASSATLFRNTIPTNQAIKRFVRLRIARL